jgi:hypothetical protein
MFRNGKPDSPVFLDLPYLFINRILNQPIDHPKKVLVLGQVDHVCLRGLHMMLQHLCVVNSNRYHVGMLEGILDYLPCSVVEHKTSFDLAKSAHQTKMFLDTKEN